MKETKGLPKGKVSRISGKDSIICGYCSTLSITGLAFITLLKNERIRDKFHCVHCKRTSTIDPKKEV